MIYTLTCNPSVDTTAYVDHVIPGSLHRLQQVIVSAGGKGINVSRNLNAIQVSSVVWGILAGKNGEYIKEVLEKEQIDMDCLWIEGETRRNLKIMDHQGKLTEFNEAGPTVRLPILEPYITHILSCIHKDDVIVLSGSIPPSLPKSLYHDLMIKIKEKDAKVILDADGELFAHGVCAGPDVIKPNRHELCQYFHLNEDCDNETLLDHAKTLFEYGIKLVVLSQGSEGAIFLTKDCGY